MEELDRREAKLLADILALVLDENQGSSEAALRKLRQRARMERVSGGALKNVFIRIATLRGDFATQDDLFQNVPPSDLNAARKRVAQLELAYRTLSVELERAQLEQRRLRSRSEEAESLVGLMRQQLIAVAGRMKRRLAQGVLLGCVAGWVIGALLARQPNLSASSRDSRDEATWSQSTYQQFTSPSQTPGSKSPKSEADWDTLGLPVYPSSLPEEAIINQNRASLPQSRLPGLSPSLAKIMQSSHVTASGVRWRILPGPTQSGMNLYIDLDGSHVATVLVAPEFLRLPDPNIELRVEWLHGTIRRAWPGQSGTFEFQRDGTLRKN